MFSEFFIKRPIFASVISIVIVLIGLISLPFLPVEKTPNITPPTVVVEGTYPGADAKTVAETVATPLEEAINGVDKMLYLSSKSSDNGRVSITVTFEVGTDVDMATVLVQNRVSLAEPKLPEEVKRQGLTTQKRSSNITMVAALISPNEKYDEKFMSNYINIRMKDALSRVKGVGNVTVFGSKDFGMRIWLNPDKLEARNITTEDIIKTVREQNVQVAAGQLGSMPSPEEQEFQFTIKTLGRLSSVEEFKNIILKVDEGGKVLRLKDVARIELGAENYYWYAKLNKKPAVAIGIFQTPGSNALSVARSVRNKLEELSQNFPAGIDYRIPYNPTKFIEESIKEVVFTLLFVIVLVVLTVYVFLQDLRTTIIPTVTIPVSLIGTFAVLMILGTSINTLTMFGLVLVIGIVVDDAIIVVENTSRIIDEEGLPPKEATTKAMKQITGPVVATTLVLLSVFVPTAVMGGITGMLYKQFAITISIATVFSSLNALTLSPALCGLLLRKNKKQHRFLFKYFNRLLISTRSSYISAVQTVVRKTGIMMMIFIILVAAAGFGFLKLPTGFIPDEDEGTIFINAKLPDGATLQRTEKVMNRVQNILADTNGIDDFVVVGGYSLLDQTVMSNAAVSFVNLEPWSKRKSPEMHVEKIVGRLQRKFYGIQDAFILAFIPPPIRGLGQAGGFQLELQDRGGAGLRELEQTANQIVYKANSSKKLTRLNSTLSASVPQKYVEINRVKAKSLNVPLSSIFHTLQTYMGSFYINDFNLFGRTYKVIAMAQKKFRNSVEDIKSLEVRNKKGEMLPLGTVIEVRDIVGPQTVTHYNLYPSSTITGNAVAGFSSGQAMQEIKKIAENTMPPSINFEWSGVSYQQKKAGNQAPIIFLLAATFAFLFLAAQYESWSIPIAIIFSVPLAMLGAVGFTFLRAYDNNIYTQIGIVLLIGLASKTAILLVEFAKSQHEKGKSVRESAVEAARLRFRPILMTAFSFIFGTLPLVIATGAGATARRALGTAVFGGMLVAVILGLILIPVFYVVVQRSKEKTVELEHKIEEKLHHKEEQKPE